MYIDYGKFFFELGELDTAENQFKKALVIQNNNSDDYKNVAKLHMNYARLMFHRYRLKSTSIRVDFDHGINDIEYHYIEATEAIDEYMDLTRFRSNYLNVSLYNAEFVELSAETYMDYSIFLKYIEEFDKAEAKEKKSIDLFNHESIKEKLKG